MSIRWLVAAMIVTTPLPAFADASADLGGGMFGQRVATELIQRRAQAVAACATGRRLPTSPPVGTGWPQHCNATSIHASGWQTGSPVASANR
jgi:hypothetical protein